MLEFTYSCATDTGLVRRNNEDASSWDAGTGLVVVADGMGGYNAGEVASALATEFIHDEMTRWMTQTGPAVSARHMARALQICVTNANLLIRQAAAANPDQQGMGTTLVLGVFSSNRLVLGHIGDSRCYLLRDEHLYQLTHDHSLLQEQLDSGLITPADALVSPQKNLVTRALGVDEEVMLETQVLDIQHDDLYLFCTDGLSDMVDEDTLAQVLRGPEHTDRKVDMLIRLANTNGGTDNVTVFLVKATDPASERAGFLGKIFG